VGLGLDVVCTGVGDGAGAGAVVGGAGADDRVGVGVGVGAAGGGVLGCAVAAGWAAALVTARCRGLRAAVTFPRGYPEVCAGVGLADAGALAGAAAWLLAVWAGALRANSTANAAAATALSCVVRQVSRERRRRPLVLLLPSGSSSCIVTRLTGSAARLISLVPASSG
jgi:hypothetical protein